MFGPSFVRRAAVRLRPSPEDSAQEGPTALANVATPLVSAAEGLSPGARRGVKAALAAFFAVQLAALPLARVPLDLWPFHPYTMFAFHIERDVRSVAVVLHQDDGLARTVRARHVIPLEFFRANSLAHDVFVRRADRALQDRMAHLLLARLNEDPWTGFDERYAAARPDPGHHFTGLDVIVQHWDFGPPADLHPPRLVRVEQIYSFSESGEQAVAAGGRR